MFKRLWHIRSDPMEFERKGPCIRKQVCGITIAAVCRQNPHKRQRQHFPYSSRSRGDRGRAGRCRGRRRCSILTHARAGLRRSIVPRASQSSLKLSRPANARDHQKSASLNRSLLHDVLNRDWQGFLLVSRPMQGPSNGNEIWQSCYAVLTTDTLKIGPDIESDSATSNTTIRSRSIRRLEDMPGQHNFKPFSVSIADGSVHFFACTRGSDKVEWLVALR